MKQHHWLHTSIRIVVIIQFLLSLVFPAGALAAASAAELSGRQAESLSNKSLVDLPGSTSGSSPLAPSAAVLQVTILSSPRLVVDSNDGATQPRVFVVEARVTNIGDTAAEDVSLTLNYNNTPSGWTLLGDEDSSRQIGTLASQASYHGYWFATYPATIGSNYTYSVTATASNVGAPVTANSTVTTVSVISAANSGITQVAFDVTVGVEFIVDIDYKLSNNAHTAHFSPVGNDDFKPDAYRLLSSTIYLYDSNNVLVATYEDRVYLADGEIPNGAVNATVVFKFIALQAANTRLCSYAMIGYNSGYKYDINYCNAASGGVIEINGSISLDFKKVADKLTVEQNELIAYTLYYTNTGTLPLKYVWLWDEYNTALVAANSYAPLPTAPETIDGRAVWYIGDVAPGASGSVMFDVLADGSGLDIADAASIVNNGFFGVTPGELPAAPAITSTVTTTVNAPAFLFTKTDEKTSIVAGQSGTYVITLTNNGHTTAQTADLVDTLPNYVTAGTPDPLPDSTSLDGKTLTWNLGPMLPGATQVVEIPYTVDVTTPNGTVLTNQATFDYSNPAGHNFTQMTASDTTAVQNAVMTISKTDSPDPVLANHALVYTLTYQNSGPAPATNVVIRDTLPLGTAFTSCTGGCSLVSGQYTWNLGTVNASSSASVTMTVMVDDLPKDSTITNSAYSLTSDQSGTVTGAAATTLVQRDAAIFNVRAYEDVNGNGQYDLIGDGLIQNVQITAQESITPTQFTGADGMVKVRVEASGLVTISANEPAGYIHSTPGLLTTQAVLGTTTEIEFGYISMSAEFAIVFGTVYEDANLNGDYDPGELGIQGATVASAQATPPNSVLTNQYGWYTLRFDDADPATIVETNKAGYVSTSPDTIADIVIEIPSNNVSPYDFGDFAGIKIAGKVFNDLNANGVDDGEDGLAGVTVSAAAKSTLTDVNGLYTMYIAVPPTDAITISETQPAGYASTNAIPGSGVVKVDNNTLSIAAPVAGTTYAGNDFGDAALAEIVTIQGFVWNDNGAGGGFAANGLREANEPGLAGATISLTGGLSTLSAVDGSFTLYGPANTQLTITETNPGVYISTNAIPGDAGTSKVDNDTLLIDPLAAGSVTNGHLFGDVLQTGLAVVTGFVYDDVNENSLKDLTETGLAGIPVFLEFQDGHFIEVPSEADGSYSFLVSPGENLLVRTSGPGGDFYPTSPTSFFFAALSATTYADINFGFSDDQNAAVIFGVVYDDMNSNGERDFGEPGLGGAQVTLDGVSNQTTLGSGITAGTYAFTITSAAGLHHVSETIHPAGYRSTTPDSLNIYVVPGSSYPADFGDTNSPEHAAIYGVVFEDFNQNGLRETGEPGLSGVLITVTTGTGDISMLTKTYGQFSYGFEIQDEGYHTVFSEDPAKPGYHSTTPDSVNLFMELNNSYQIDFGDAQNGNSAMILGTVFQDENGDGNQDSSELGLSGVTVNLTGGKTATTNSYGWYNFRIDAQGLYQVTEVDPAGYYSTTPNQVPVNVTAWTNYTVNFGDLNNPNFVVFYGTVFNDLNASGARDTNELGLADVTVTLENGITVLYQTNQWGHYSFLIDEPGTYTVTEQDPGGYVSTNAIPGSASVLKVDANTFSTVIGLSDFGNALPDNLFGDVLPGSVATISGMVWEDLDADGVKDAGEPGLAGANVSLSTGLSQTTLTDGLYSIYAPAATPVQIVEQDPAGYFSTNAIPGTNGAKLTNNIIQISGVAAGSASTGNNFGDTYLAEAGVISGYVFNDKDGNGLFDGLDTGLAGVTLTLNGGTTTTSASDGYYQFVVTTAGVYTLVETDPAGYFSTTPNEIHVNLVIGNSYEVHFGDAAVGSGFGAIFGIVFDDLNFDTVWDANEPGISGVNVSRDNNAAATTTNIFGVFVFGVAAGPHSVTETDPAGYLSSTPNLVNVTVANGEGVLVTFGDFVPCAIVKDLHEEDDTLDQAKPIAGFGSANAYNFSDDASDWFTFQAGARGTYTITVSAIGQRTDSIVTVYGPDKVTVLAVNDDVENTTDFSSQVVFVAPSRGTHYVHIANRNSLQGCRTDYELTVEEKPDPTKYLYLPLIMKEYTPPQPDAAAEVPLGSISLPGAPSAAEDTLAPNGPESPDGVINHMICTDDYEVDDTWEQANEILPGVIQLHSFDSNTALYAADKDHAWFAASQLDQVSFTITVPAGSLAETAVELYDADRNLLSSGTTSLSWNVTRDGNYYLILTPTNDAFGCADVTGYNLEMTKVDARKLYLPMIFK